MKAKAPGKLILSGEHAVVYGCPAIVMAVARYAHATADIVDRDPASETALPELLIDAPQILGTGSIPIRELAGVRTRLDQRHADFLAGTCRVGDIITDYLDLAYYCAALIREQATDPVPTTQLRLTTDIPIGCGMGSSAAIIAATLAALARIWGLSPPSTATLYEWTLAAERLQHGRPSGVDPFIVTHGGCIRFQRGQAIPLDCHRMPECGGQTISNDPHSGCVQDPTCRRARWARPAGPSVPGYRIKEFGGQTSPESQVYMVMTGVPTVTTGQSVVAVGERFGALDPIWKQFAECTDGMQTAIENGDRQGLQEQIRENHRLLCHIGVVPPPVRAFAEAVEASGGAAKICGAGATAGDAAGVVLVVGIDGETTARLCRDAGMLILA